jgi:hypothetical protein
MKYYINYIILSLVFLLISISIVAQTKNENHNRWDMEIINESDIWRNLLVNYNCTDINTCWPDRQKALYKIVNEYPKSQWVDDALIMHTCDKAIIDNDLDNAIVKLREIQKEYPSESTIIDGWHYQRGCYINATWLMNAPSLVVRNENNIIIKTYPFDRDSILDDLELETLAYFNHLDKYPQLTKDIVQYIIALMYLQKGEIEKAINELEALLSNKDLQNIRNIDFEASKKPNGNFLESVPPYDVAPLWRVELASSQLLLNLYSEQNHNVKLIEFSNKIANEFSPDGWYWQLNRNLGIIYEKHKYFIKAKEQYDIAINGIKQRSIIQAKKMQRLYEKGLAIKAKDFVSWEEEANKTYSADIAEIEKLKNNLKK